MSLSFYIASIASMLDVCESLGIICVGGLPYTTWNGVIPNDGSVDYYRSIQLKVISVTISLVLQSRMPINIVLKCCL